MAKQSPVIRLDAARRAYRLAEQNCAHWDYESDGDGDHDCCVAMRAAQHELRLAREAQKRSEAS